MILNLLRKQFLNLKSIKGQERNELLGILLVFLCAIAFRLSLFGESGGDFNTYLRAVNDFKNGENPYIYTIRTFQDEKLGNQGYAYFPPILYIFTLLSYVHDIFKLNIPLHVLWKIPVLLADIGIGILIVKYLWKKDFLLTIFALCFWYFNPYIALTQNYTSPDPIPIFLLLLSIYLLPKYSFASGSVYSLAIMTKTFPVLLLPIIFLSSKNNYRFVLGGIYMFMLMSLPFMLDLNAYLYGALFVNSERFTQGRPFLFYIAHKYDIIFLQLLPFKFFSISAIISGWLLSLMFYIKKTNRDVLMLSFLPFLTFYLFTPVLNKTYLMWVMPFMSIGLYRFFKARLGYYYFLTLFYFIFYCFYLAVWTYSFQYGFRN